MAAMYMFILSLYLIQATNGQVPSSGSCPKVTTIKEFDLQQVNFTLWTIRKKNLFNTVLHTWKSLTKRSDTVEIWLISTDDRTQNHSFLISFLSFPLFVLCLYPFIRKLTPRSMTTQQFCVLTTIEPRAKIWCW